MPVIVDGDLLEDDEVRDLLRMFDHDCKEFAGAFFDNDRSDTFRTHWKDIAEQIPETRAYLNRISHDAVGIQSVLSQMDVNTLFLLRNAPENPTAEDCFLMLHWKRFAQHARTWYGQLLGDPAVPEARKQRMFKAICLLNMMAEVKQGGEDVLQVDPRTEHFLGDRRENREIDGKGLGAFKARLMASGSRMVH